MLHTGDAIPPNPTDEQGILRLHPEIRRSIGHDDEPTAPALWSELPGQLEADEYEQIALSEPPVDG